METRPGRRRHGFQVVAHEVAPVAQAGQVGLPKGHAVQHCGEVAGGLARAPGRGLIQTQGLDRTAAGGVVAIPGLDQEAHADSSGLPARELVHALRGQTQHAFPVHGHGVRLHGGQGPGQDQPEPVAPVQGPAQAVPVGAPVVPVGAEERLGLGRSSGDGLVLGLARPSVFQVGQGLRAVRLRGAGAGSAAGRHAPPAAVLHADPSRMLSVASGDHAAARAVRGDPIGRGRARTGSHGNRHGRSCR